jgi:phage gpG-like protein
LPDAPKTIAPVRIHVTGLNEFRNSLRRAHSKTPQELTKTLRSIGNEAKKRVRTKLKESYVTPPARRTGRLAQDIHVLTKGDQMSVTLGAATPYAGWWEFGGNTVSPPPLREAVKGGRALYPVLQEMRPDIEFEMEMLIQRLWLEFEAGA